MCARKTAKQEEYALMAQATLQFASETPKFVSRDGAMWITALRQPTSRADNRAEEGRSMSVPFVWSRASAQ